MEKIVSKIGDVAADRKVSKHVSNFLEETSVKSLTQLNHQFCEVTKSSNSEDEIKLLNVSFKNSQNDTLRLNESVVSIPSKKAFNLDEGEVTFSTKQKPFESNDLTRMKNEGLQHLNEKYISNEDISIIEMEESGESLPKVPRINIGEVSNSQSTVKTEPKMSDFVGINVIGKQTSNSEPQSSEILSGKRISQDSFSNFNSKQTSLKEKLNSKLENVKSEEVFLHDEPGDLLTESDFERNPSHLNERELEEVENLSNSSSQFQEDSCKKSIKSELQEVAVVNDEFEEPIKIHDVEDDDIIEEEELQIKTENKEHLKQSLGVEDQITGDLSESDVKEPCITDLVELMQKGEIIEGEIEDVKDEEMIIESDEKLCSKRKAGDGDDEEEEDDNSVEKEDDENKNKSQKKKRKTHKSENEEDESEEDEKNKEEDDSEGKDKNIDKSKVTNANLRKNIREVMDETKLDEATLAAQRQEAERLKRLQEQQRIIREVQRQIALNKQSQKSQSKVLSLLQSNSQTSILKTSSVASQAQTSQIKSHNSVLVKLSNGEQTSLSNKKMLELLKNSKSKTVLEKPPIPKTLFKQGMVTPSVSIAPIAKKEPEVDDKKKKKGDIVTLSSDSEDDCIVLSDDEESEPEEDPTNSGMHTNDKYNIPDENGKVLVNVGHPDTEADLYLAPQIAKIIKPHQIGGIRFMYDNVIESIERFSSSAGFGCILAHSMGLGKTLQIVSFSDIFLKYTSAKTILCIMPINTIQNWLAEFNMWLPKESSSSEVRCRDFDLFIVNESLKNINARARVILEWQKSGGVLLMGYELFRLLSLKKSYKSKKKKKSFEVEDTKYKELIEEVYSALVIPGPDLVICDEGHRIKNSHATTSQALKQIRTKRRIVLTGYPLQNNLLEYWCMVDFVRPNYLGTKTEFSNMFERPIQNGQCIDSTPQDKRLMRYRAHVLHSLLEGFVQRRSHAVLQSALPEKEEYVLLLRFTPFQRKLYDTFMNEVVRTVAVPNPLKAFAVCCKIWNHPDVLYNFLKRKGEEIDLDLEEALPPSLQIPQYPYVQQTLGSDGINQQSTPLPPWPKRGPGSRGGKVRQPTTRRVGRGRKPAATIPPNVTTEKDKPNDAFGTGQYSANENFSENVNTFQRRNYNHNQFGFTSEYSSPSGFTDVSYNKSSLSNLEGMSSSYQGKRFFSHQNEAVNHRQFGGSSQNFEPNQVENNFNQRTSNNSNLNASFESNFNSSDSTYNQNDSTKSFEFNQDYGLEFYQNNNMQNSRSNSNYSRESKSGVSQSNPPYYENSSFRNLESFDYQNNINSNFQGYERQNFQNYPNQSFQHSVQGSETNTTSRVQASNCANSISENNFSENGSNSQTPNFQSNYRTPDTNYETNRFGSNANSNYQGTNSGFGVNRSKHFQAQNPETSFQEGSFEQGFPWSQSHWNYNETSKSDQNSQRSTTGQSELLPQKYSSCDERQETKSENKNYESGNSGNKTFSKINCDYSDFGKSENNSKVIEVEETKVNKEEEEKKEEGKSSESLTKKDDASLPYDWATDLFKTYVTGVIENSSKMEVFVEIVTESIKLGDRLLVFSQSLLTLDLIEDYFQRRNVPDKEEVWTKNKNYFRLDGSTPGLEREKLINEFNCNTNIHMFLVSTRAGSLGINLVGANRVVVFDASWNPCHDTQAVCRVYRYGQRKPCFVYRLVMDSCLEKKIYDRQVNKQGMADRVVDELNPDAHLSIKEVTNLCWDDQEDTTVKDFSNLKDKYNDEIIKILLDRCSKLLSKEPFQHESLLIDRKEKKLSQAEKRLAKRSYELEKQAANQPKNIYSFFPNTGQRTFSKPVASVRPMQSEMGSRIAQQLQNRSKWIPAEVWQKQGMSAQEMTLPLDVVIPTSSPEKTSIVLKAGQRVMVLKSPKGIYMQLENGKIIAIRSAFKVGQNGPGAASKQEDSKKDGSVSTTTTVKSPIHPALPSKALQSSRQGLLKQPFLKPFSKQSDKKIPVNMNLARSKQVTGKAKPFLLNRKFESVTPDVKQRLLSERGNFIKDDEKMDRKDEGSVSDENKRNSFKSDVYVNDIEYVNEKSIEKDVDKPETPDSLETLRKVTEKISDSSQLVAEGNGKYSHTNSLKNYRHNFTSQTKGNLPVFEEQQKQVETDESKEKSGKTDVSGTTQQHQGSENVQNWLMNQPYPQLDPYGNYFPGYYYGPGPGHMPMPPYDGIYSPNNYGHSMGKNSSASPSNSKAQSAENTKSNSQSLQPNSNQMSNHANPNAPTNNSPAGNTPPMYPPYPNPYSYPYNYSSNHSFNNQGYPLPNQNQNPQQPQNPPNTSNTTASSQSQPSGYENSAYSAFHRPDGPPFQSPQNPYPVPYPRPPYSNSGNPGFFPYNTPLPNYSYSHNFNPYMHSSSYGYPMQNSSSHSTQGTHSLVDKPVNARSNNTNDTSGSSAST